MLFLNNAINNVRAEKKMSSRKIQLHSKCRRCKHCGKRERECSIETRRNCPKCGMEISRTGLYPHMKYHCKSNPKRKKRTYSAKSCPICKKRLHSASFARHVKTHRHKRRSRKVCTSARCARWLPHRCLHDAFVQRCSKPNGVRNTDFQNIV